MSYVSPKPFTSFSLNNDLILKIYEYKIIDICIHIIVNEKQGDNYG